MWDWINATPTTLAVVLLVMISLIRGWLIPRRIHLDRIADFTKAIDAKDATIAELNRQVAILMTGIAEHRPSS